MTELTNLYETVNRIYSESTPMSRLLFVAKLKEGVKETTAQPPITIFTNDIKTIGRRIEGFNFCIINLGNNNTIVLLEVRYIKKEPF